MGTVKNKGDERGTVIFFMNHVSTEILFEKFEIIECLKKDGQAGVYLANHIFLSKKIILKTLNTDGLADKTILERFKREAKILAQLDHPNVIKVLDFGTYNNFFYISFEYFPGKNLREIIKAGSLSVDDKTRLAVQLLKALNSAHQNEIIHRDIKPENILVSSSLELKIADFGLALVMNDNNVTQSSTIVGTPGYMSPEQIRGEKTHQTDLFSAGLVCFELFTGRNPVLGKDIGTTINNILNFKSDIINSDLEKLPVPVRQTLESMLQNNISKRAKSAADLLKFFGIQENREYLFKAIRKPQKFYYYLLFLVIVIVISVIIYYNNFRQSVQQNHNKQTDTLTSTVQNNGVPIPAENDKNVLLSANTKDDKLQKIQKPGGNIAATNNIGTTNGQVSIDCFPWAEVFIDNKKIDITPVNNYSLTPGKHKIELFNPDYPAYRKIVTINPGKPEMLKLNYNELIGYLTCNVYPWGKIFINDDSIGTTPLSKPIALMPGKYRITVKNENFSSVSKEITVKAKQKFNFSLNFNDLNK